MQDCNTIRNQMYELNRKEFDLFRKFIFERSGISLNESKLELVRTRLVKRLRQLNIPTFKQYYKLVSDHPDEPELYNMLDAITTNQTSFFREPKHFAFLSETVLPQLLEEKEKKRNKIFKIWSAGCSTGEEPYSLAVTLLEFLKNRTEYDIKILATDLSLQVLNTAARGIYEKNKLKDIPVQNLKKYFLRGEKEWESFYKVKPILSRIIQFKRFNLMENHFPFSSSFDIIFCRNVMIYFDKKTQEILINKYYSVLGPSHFLFIGHSESLMSINHKFNYVQPTIYRK